MTYSLYTPTDWNKEAELLKKYLSDAIYSKNVLMDINAIPNNSTAKEILSNFMRIGYLFINSADNVIPLIKQLSFDEWKATTNKK